MTTHPHKPQGGPTAQSSFAALWIRSLTKQELHSLVDEVQRGENDSISRAVTFVISESFGVWHNRARAKLCRYFKNHPPSNDQCQQMVDAIVARLIEGRFYEQFKDQLSMAVRLDRDQLARAQIVAARSKKEYVRRYSDWLGHTLDSLPPFPGT